MDIRYGMTLGPSTAEREVVAASQPAAVTSKKTKSLKHRYCEDAEKNNEDGGVIPDLGEFKPSCQR